MHIGISYAINAAGAFEGNRKACFNLEQMTQMRALKIQSDCVLLNHAHLQKDLGTSNITKLKTN